ncbi:MAG: imelysin family protein, partial [Bacteroidota bacterium]
MKRIYLALIILTALFFVDCKRQSSEKDTQEGFEVQQLLQEVTDQVIMPALVDFDKKAGILDQLANTYSKNPDESQLEALREQWVKTALAYERTYNFHIGQAKSRFLHQAIYNWPTVP